MGNTRLEFCDRLIDGSTKTCKEMGSLRLYEKRKLEEPAIKEYKRSGGRWEARYTTGIDPKTGKQTQKSVYGKTQKKSVRS